MARLARLAIDQQLHHVVHRARPGALIAHDDSDRSQLLDALLAVTRELSVAVHAYVVLPDRWQMLLTPRRGADLSLAMQRVGRRHVGALNARHGGAGSPWDGRYRCAVLQASTQLIDAMRLIDTAPVRAGLADHPADWAASSAAHHLGRRSDPLVTDHPAFWQLGNTPFEREARFRQLCEVPVEASRALAIERATEGGWVLGDEAFAEALARGQARRLLPGRRGRPPSARD